MADVIKVKPSARVILQKNSGAVLVDQQFSPAAAAYTSHVAQAQSLLTNTTTSLALGGIATVRNLLLQADNKCVIKVNGQVTTGLDLVGTNSMYVAYSTSITAVSVVNESTTNTVTVNYVATN